MRACFRGLTPAKVGWLQFINIAGSAAGAWAITWVGFPNLGTATLLQSLAGLSLIYPVVLLIRRHWSIGLTLAVAVGLVMVVRIIPANPRFWQVLNGLDRADRFIFDENESAVSVIKLAPDPKTGVVFVNGLGQSVMPYRNDNIHTLLGALPVMIHPNPEHMAVIGLGSAGTLNGMAGRPETRRIDCFEIASNQARVLAAYAAKAGDTAITGILNDRRLRLIFRDGRYAIRNRNVYYDVIEADALRPNSAYPGNRYSKEYFELIRSRLKPNGLAVTWCPTGRVLNTFRSVFPYVAYGDKLVLIGSNQPIILDWNQINGRAVRLVGGTPAGRGYPSTPCCKTTGPNCGCCPLRLPERE